MAGKKISRRELERQYKAMLKAPDVEGVVKPETTCCYRCVNPGCRHITKTITVDKGIIPPVIKCEECKGNAMTTFFEDTAPDKKPTIEWYRPNFEQVFKWRKMPHMMEHIIEGKGLVNREKPKSLIITDLKNG